MTKDDPFRETRNYNIVKAETPQINQLIYYRTNDARETYDGVLESTLIYLIRCFD